MHVASFAVALQPSVVPVGLKSCRNVMPVMLVWAQRLLVDSKVCPVMSSPTVVTSMNGWPAGCRTMDCDQDSASFNFTEGKGSSYPNVFSRPLTLQETDMKMVSPVSEASSSVIFYFILLKRACADVLLPKLKAEQEHASLPNVIRRKKEVEYRVRCGNILEVQILDASSRIDFSLRRFMHE
jgi:hypothetical protein